MKEQVNERKQALNLVNFYGSLVSREKYIELMKNQEEREAYLDYLKG